MPASNVWTNAAAGLSYFNPHEKGTKMRRTLIPFVLILLVSITGPALATENPQVVMETSKGTVVFELNGRKAPMTTANFIAYVESGFYNNTVFHRVIRDFMIQGGGFTPDLQRKSNRPPILNEADNGLKNNTGTIAMARTPDPHTATSQFFINVKDNISLNHRSKSDQGWGYCVFGRVIKGMEVVRAIEMVPTTRKGNHHNVPVEPVVIKSMTTIKHVKAAGPTKSK